MNFLRQLLPVALGVLLLAGCEKSIKVDVPDQQPKLVLNAVVTSGDTIRLNLGRSLSIRESGKTFYTSVAGARVILYVDGKVADTLRNNIDVDSSEYDSRIVASPGKTYRLHISAVGYADVDASAASPQPVAITGWFFQPDSRQLSSGTTQDQVRITFTDPATAGDYYIIRLTSASDGAAIERAINFYSQGTCISGSDPSVESPYPGDLGDDICLSSNAIFVRDGLINGATKEIAFYTSSGFLSSWNPGMGGTPYYAHAALYHVTADFYNYLKSYIGARDAGDNPFAEPYNVRTNVQGGYGIFAIIASDTAELDF